MKKIIILMLLISVSALYSQSVSISSDGAAPDPSAILDIQSSDKGVLFPRVDFYKLPSGTNGLLAYILENGFNGNGTFYGYFGTWHSINKWGQAGSNIYYNNGKVAIGVAPNSIDPLKVSGGILFEGNATSITPGLLFYNSVDEKFYYYDNTSTVQELGENVVTATYPRPLLAGTGSVYNGLRQQITPIYQQPIIPPELIIIGYDTTYVDNYVTNDTLGQDFILKGRLGIGMDCNNGENFGQEQIKLKENNLRLCFDDNSDDDVNNNWIIEANQSSNGGKNYFAFGDFTDSTYNFVVESQNRTHAAYLLGTNLGIGTQFPQTQMHLVYSESISLRLEQDESDENTAQVWDVSFDDTGITIADVTNSNETPVFIASKVENAIYIDANGNVGIGTDNPTRDLHINGAVRMEPQSAVPANPSKGDIYFDDNDNKMKCYDGTQWQNLW